MQDFNVFSEDAPLHFHDNVTMHGLLIRLTPMESIHVNETMSYVENFQLMLNRFNETIRNVADPFFF